MSDVLAMAMINANAIHGQRLFEDASTPAAKPQQQRMWDHFCQSEHGLMSTAAGEECSWCGAREGDR